MESISELRKICQSTAQQDRSNVYMRYVSRFFSIYLTRLILPTSVTPNQVSLAMIVTGMIASTFFLCPSRFIFLIGAILLQLWYIIDCMDGEVARYRHYQATGSVVMSKNECKLTGVYFDIINHYIVNLLVPITISFGLFLRIDNSFFILLGIIAALGQVLLLAMHDGRYRTILNYLKKYERVEFVPATPEEEKERGFAHSVFAVLHYTVTYPTVMNLVLIAACLNFIFSAVEWRSFLVLYLAAVSILVTSTFISRTIVKQMIEREVQSQFKMTDEQNVGR